MQDYFIISVESRKGGVGKTTAALNLGYLLREKYHVLLLDIDITGTSISAVQKSSFWKDNVFIVKDIDNKNLNLLHFFTKNYLKGQDLLNFTSKDERKKIPVKDSTINVIVSELYDEDNKMLYDPSILLGNIHVFWFIEMIKKIINNFRLCFDDKKKCVILLDNSPGFVGIGKAVHDLLIDEGPLVGKFLSISSLDTQDLQSCLKATSTIHSDYITKFDNYHNPDTSEDNGKFYVQVKLSREGEYEYYKDSTKKESLSSYHGLVINKVAKDIVEGISTYDFEQLFTPSIKHIFDELTIKGISSYMVPFDIVLMTQFYSSLIHKDINKKNRNSIKSLNYSLGTIEKHINRIENNDDLHFDLLRIANSIDKSIINLKYSLVSSDYEIISSKISDEWSPIWPLQKILLILKEQGLAPESKELSFPKREVMKKQIRFFGLLPQFKSHFLSYNNSERMFIDAVFSVLCEIKFCCSNVAGENDSKVNESHIKNDFLDWRRICEMSVKWIIRILRSYKKSEKKDLASFILGEEAAKDDHNLDFFVNSREFIMSFKQAVSRLMDIAPDIRTLLNVIHIVTVNNEGRYSKDVDFTSLLNRKILTKEYNYDIAKEKMYDELRDSDYMGSFRGVLSNVIQKWNL